MAPSMDTMGASTSYSIVLEDCIGCGVCEKMCPNKAIVHTEGLEDYRVLPEECAGCAVCLIYCPTNAILEPGEPFRV